MNYRGADSLASLTAHGICGRTGTRTEAQAPVHRAGQRRGNPCFALFADGSDGPHEDVQHTTAPSEYRGALPQQGHGGIRGAGDSRTAASDPSHQEGAPRGRGDQRRAAPLVPHRRAPAVWPGGGQPPGLRGPYTYGADAPCERQGASAALRINCTSTLRALNATGCGDRGAGVVGAASANTPHTAPALPVWCRRRHENPAVAVEFDLKQSRPPSVAPSAC
jgi:hypothetical protein